VTGPMIGKQLIAIALLAHLCFLLTHIKLEPKHGQAETLLTADILPYDPVAQTNPPQMLLQDMESAQKWQGEPGKTSTVRASKMRLAVVVAEARVEELSPCCWYIWLQVSVRIRLIDKFSC
jgi:hypothetical protein